MPFLSRQTGEHPSPGDTWRGRCCVGEHHGGRPRRNSRVHLPPSPRVRIHKRAHGDAGEAERRLTRVTVALPETAPQGTAPPSPQGLWSADTGPHMSMLESQ